MLSFIILYLALKTNLVGFVGLSVIGFANTDHCVLEACELGQKILFELGAQWE